MTRSEAVSALVAAGVREPNAAKLVDWYLADASENGLVLFVDPILKMPRHARRRLNQRALFAATMADLAAVDG